MLTAHVVENVSADERLQQSRRLDWRFLLPAPGLGDIGYAGREGDALFLALRAFSHSVVLLGAGNDRGHASASLDGIVVRQPSSPRQLAALAQSVRPGGFLYAELRRKPVDVLLNRYSAGAYRETIMNLGYRDIELHWHWPNFEACTRFVPLNDPAPLMFDLGKGESALRGRTIRAAARVAITTGLMARLVPCISLVALRETP